MAKPCSICTHPQRSEIEALLIEGVSIRDIAGRFGTSKTAVHRHLREHMKAEIQQAVQARQEASHLRLEALLDRLLKLVERAELLASKCEVAEDFRSAVACLAEARQTLLTVIGIIHERGEPSEQQPLVIRLYDVGRFMSTGEKVLRAELSDGKVISYDEPD